tara:strand:+ start:445 stop:840 length:396 start_codon:yes stop_codon:yes gene_type:complete
MSSHFDCHSYLGKDVALDSQALTGATAGVIVDTKDFESLDLVMQTSVVTGDSVFKLEHGEDIALADATDVLPADLIDDQNLTILAADGASQIKSVGYRGKKRYVRLAFVSGTATASGMFIKGDPKEVPVAN